MCHAYFTVAGLHFSAWRLALMSWTIDWPARSQYNGLSDPFLLNCGRIESVAWLPKNCRRSFGPNKTGLGKLSKPHLHPRTPACTTESNLQSVIWPWVVESRLQDWFTRHPHPKYILLLESSTNIACRFLRTRGLLHMSQRRIWKRVPSVDKK